MEWGLGACVLFGNDFVDGDYEMRVYDKWKSSEGFERNGVYYYRQ